MLSVKLSNSGNALISDVDVEFRFGHLENVRCEVGELLVFLRRGIDPLVAVLSLLRSVEPARRAILIAVDRAPRPDRAAILGESLGVLCEPHDLLRNCRTHPPTRCSTLFDTVDYDEH